MASDLKTYGEAHSHVATYRNNLGGVWYSLDEYQKAIDYLEQVLVIMAKKLKYHPLTKVMRANLAGAREKPADAATK